MKVWLSVLVAIAVIGATFWSFRLDILFAVMPKLMEMRLDVSPNRPLEWEQGPEEAELPPDQRPPNIVLILVDDMGFNDISLHNGGAADGTLQMPHIDALANAGVKFSTGYSAHASCAPTRAALMTGRYPTRVGFEYTPFVPAGGRLVQWVQDKQEPPLLSIIDHEVSEALPMMSELGLPSSEITIAEMLKDKGYYTAHVGKWHLGEVNGMHPLDQGFDQSLGLGGPLFLPKDHPDVLNAKRDTTVELLVWANSMYFSYWEKQRIEPKGYLTDYFTDQAVEVINNNRNRPFFLYLAHWGIHNPIQAEREDYEAVAHIEDHYLRTYAAMILSIDRSVQKVTEALEANGLEDNTLILLSSDNGGANYIGLPRVNYPFRGWKLTNFEGGIRVPFMAKWPARIEAGTVFDAPVHHFDLTATIAAAAGVEVPESAPFDGVDLVPYVTNEKEGLPHEALFWRSGHHQAVRHDGWKLITNGIPEEMRWLFNLNEDPTEQVNLAEQRPEKVTELEALLTVHNAEQQEPMWPSFINSPMLIDKHELQMHTYEPGDEFIYWQN